MHITLCVIILFLFKIFMRQCTIFSNIWYHGHTTPARAPEDHIFDLHIAGRRSPSELITGLYRFVNSSPFGATSPELHADTPCPSTRTSPIFAATARARLARKIARVLHCIAAVAYGGLAALVLVAPTSLHCVWSTITLILHMAIDGISRGWQFKKRHGHAGSAWSLQALI
jgi:hypothetical protein